MVMVEEKKSATDALIVEMGISRTSPRRKARPRTSRTGRRQCGGLEVNVGGGGLAEAEPAMRLLLVLLHA